MKIFQMPCIRGASMKALLGFLYKDLVRSSPAAAVPFMKILAKVFFTLACEKIFKRSW